jgi:hypothetical protein
LFILSPWSILAKPKSLLYNVERKAMSTLTPKLTTVCLSVLALSLCGHTIANAMSTDAMIPDPKAAPAEPPPAPTKFVITELRPISLDDAANNIRHVRKKFSPSASKLEPATALSLAELFAIADLMALTKAEVNAHIITEGKSGLAYRDHLSRAKKIMEMIDTASKPDELVPVYEILRRVAAEQIRFRRGHQFRTSDFRQEGTMPPLFKREYSSARISENLEEAYNYLLKLYPDECPINRQSFSDHLKAVDPCHTPGEN